jgi:ribosomal protein L5
MWKKYNRFYTQRIKSELGVTQLCKNVNQIPCIKKISLTCVCDTPNNIKNVLMTLSALQLIVNKKAAVVISKQSLALMKIRKGQPLGAKIFLTGDTALQFFNYFTFNLMPKLDLLKLIPYNNGNTDFKFFIKSSTIFTRLGSFFNFFQFLPPVQVVLSLGKNSKKKTIFFLRFLKLPVSFSSKEN